MPVSFFNSVIAKQIINCYSNGEEIIKSDLQKGLEDSEKFHKVMKEFNEGKLKSPSGEKITDKRQAIAIAYSEANDVEKSGGFDIDKISSEHDENETEGYQELEDKKIVTDFDKDNKNNY